MSLLLQYILKLSVGLSIVWIFYALFLRRLTFYDLNRWYLVLYPLVAFFIPFINISPVIEKNDWSSNELVRIIPVVDNYTGFQNSLPASGSLSETIGFGIMEWAFVLIVVGVFAMIIRLGLLYFSFLQIRKNARLINNEKVKVYQVDRHIIPFSFGNSIFINQHQHGEAELREIIRHEFIHVKQKHSMDIIWAEIVCMINWYNPFAWLIRKAIRQNLEFIADNQVLKTGLDKKQYQYLLLKVIGIAPISIANNFNFSSLKTRIAMMNKMRSAKMHMIRFLFLIPILAVMLLAFRNGIQTGFETKNAASVSAIAAQIPADTIPAKPSVRASATREAEPGEAAEPKPVSNAKNNNVKSIRIKDNKAVVELKNGRTKSFDLNNESERADYESNYAYPPPSPIMVQSPAFSVSPQTVSISGVGIQSSPAIASAPSPVTVVAAISAAPVQVSGQSLTTVYSSPVISGIATATTPATSVNVTGVISNTAVAAPVKGHVAVSGIAVPPAPTAVLSAPTAVAGSVHSYYESGLEGEKIVEIKRKTTKEELEQIKKDLAEKGFTFEIKDISYDNGIITSISGSVTKGKQKTSFSSNGFSRITIYEVTRKDGTKGFNLYVSDGKTAV